MPFQSSGVFFFCSMYFEVLRVCTNFGDWYIKIQIWLQEFLESIEIKKRRILGPLQSALYTFSFILGKRVCH